MKEFKPYKTHFLTMIKLNPKIDDRKITWKYPKYLETEYHTSNKILVKEETKREVRNYFEVNKMKIQHIKIWETATAVLRANFIALNAHNRNEEKF